MRAVMEKWCAWLEVGTAAVQLGKARGLRVLATAGTTEGLELVRKLGADRVFNHREPDYQTAILVRSHLFPTLTCREDGIEAATEGKGGVDVIVEMLANVNLNSDLALLRQNGRVAIVGSRGAVEVDPRQTMAKETSIHGVALAACTKVPPQPLPSHPSTPTPPHSPLTATP